MSDNLRGTVEELHKAFEQFKSYHEEALQDVAKRGDVDPLIKEAREKADEAIDKTAKEVEQLQEEQRRLRAAMDRGAGKAGNDVDPEHKARVLSLSTGQEVDVTAADEYSKAWVQRIRQGGAPSPEVEKALQVGMDRSGGFVVEPNRQGRIVERVYETSPMRQIASVQTIGTDRMQGMLDLDDAGGSWGAEMQQRERTRTPQLGEWEIRVHPLYAYLHFSQEILEDAAFDLESWIDRHVSRRFARKENSAFVNGDGVKKPRGFLSYPSGEPDAEDWDRIKRINTGKDGGFPSDGAADWAIKALYEGLKEEYRGNATWVMNRFTESAIRQLKDDDGRYLWQPDISQRGGRNLVGSPVLNFEDMPSISTSGADAIAVGDFEEAYIVVDRMGMMTMQDPYSRKGVVGFYFWSRTGGDVVNPEAITIVRASA